MSPGSTPARWKAAEAATTPSCDGRVRRERAAQTAERGAGGGEDDGVGHGVRVSRPPGRGRGRLIACITDAIRLQRHGARRARILRQRAALCAPRTWLRGARRRQESPPRHQLHRPRRPAPVPARAPSRRSWPRSGPRTTSPRTSSRTPIRCSCARSRTSPCASSPGREARFLTPEQGNYSVHARGRRRHLPARGRRAPRAARRVDARRRQRLHARPRARALGRRRADRRAAPRRRAPRRARPAAGAVPDREDPAASATCATSCASTRWAGSPTATSRRARTRRASG